MADAMNSGFGCVVLLAVALAACSEGSGGGPGASGGTGGTGAGATGAGATGSGATGSGATGAGASSSGGSGSGATGSGATGSGATGSGGSTALPEVCEGDPLTEWEQMMLDSHNEWRAAANPPAADMLRVHWDKSIAQNAANWVASCDPDWPHSPAETHQVGGYDELGENLSYCGGSACSIHPKVTDGSGKGDGEGWWEERHDYDYASDSSTGGQISHYTQLMSSNIYAMGCATQRCDAPGPFGWDGEWWWTICQYGPRGQGYWVGTRPYETGAGGLVEPPASVYDDHPALCGSVE